MTSRIYTRTGDAGDTGLFGGGRVPKDHPRVEAYGTVDELNAALGVALAAVADGWVRESVLDIQPDLFVVGAMLATPPPAPGRRAPSIPTLAPGRVAELEARIDRAESDLEALRAFIMPGGSPGGAALHMARTVCRRAERRVVELMHGERDASQPEHPPHAGDDGGEPGPGNEARDGIAHTIVYLNRLSDLLFSLARLENRRAGRPEREWVPGTESQGSRE